MSDIIQDQEDSRLLNKIQKTREQIMDHLVKGGIPTDRNDREFLLQAMNSASSTILNKAKIKSDAAAAQNQAAAAKTIAEVLLKYKPGKSDATNNNLPELEMGNFSTNPGETDIGALPVTYDEIMNK